MFSRTEGAIDDSVIGGNAFAEGPEGEGTESTVVTSVDIVMNYHVQETSFTKEAYKNYIKDYMKSLKGKLEEQKPERVKHVMAGAVDRIKHILSNFLSFLFFFFLVFRDRVSLCSSGCPGTHSVDQGGLELRNPPASASRVLGLKACTTTPGTNFNNYSFGFFLLVKT
uniref:Translationally-controlled tumor protein n=1 Tax=Mus spicilegus TaxID=10103 RepID=A0A8C6I9J9_MUSSI